MQPSPAQSKKYRFNFFFSAKSIQLRRQSFRNVFKPLLLAFLLLSPVMVRELDVDLDALAGGLALAARLLLLLLLCG
jgi:hypothetical protein